jgi:hypothetical protein
LARAIAASSSTPTTMQAHLYAPSTMEGSSYISRYFPHCFDDDGYVDEDALLEARSEFDMVTSVAEAVRCYDDNDNYYEDFSMWPPPVLLDNESSTSTTTTTMTETTTTVMAHTVRFVLRCVGSGLVVDAHAGSVGPIVHCARARPSLTDDDADAKADDGNSRLASLEGRADGSHDEALSADEENGAPSSSSSPFKLYPRFVGRPSQEWTMVSTAATCGDYGDDGSGTGTATSKVQLVNMGTMQRLVCTSNNPDESSDPTSHLQLLTPRQYRKVVQDVDAAWTLTSEGTILSSASRLALTDDGAGNLALRPPSTHSLSVEQQWQLIPIV